MQAKQSHFLSLDLLIQLEKVSSLPESFPSILSSFAAPMKGTIPQQTSRHLLIPAPVLPVPWLLSLRLGKKKTQGWKISSLKGKVRQNPGRTWQTDLTMVAPLADVFVSALLGAFLWLCSIGIMFCSCKM